MGFVTVGDNRSVKASKHRKTARNVKGRLSNDGKIARSKQSINSDRNRNSKRGRVGQNVGNEQRFKRQKSGNGKLIVLDSCSSSDSDYDPPMGIPPSPTEEHFGGQGNPKSKLSKDKFNSVLDFNPVFSNSVTSVNSLIGSGSKIANTHESNRIVTVQVRSFKVQSKLEAHCMHLAIVPTEIFPLKGFGRSHLKRFG